MSIFDTFTSSPGVVDGLTNGTSYRSRIKAIGPGGESTYSAWSSPFTPGSGEPLALKYAAPDTTGYTVINVPTSGYTATLAHNTDYVFNMPSTPVTAPVWIKGGRNVVMRGGEIKIDTITFTTPPGANESTQQGIYIIRHPTAGVHGGGRIIHIEGVKIGGYYLSDGIRTASNDGGPTDVDLRIQNCRIEQGMWYRDGSAASGNQGSPHGDILQPFGGIGYLRVSGLTGLMTAQGFMLKADFNGPNAGWMELDQVNLRENTNPNIEYNDAGATYPRPAGSDFRTRYYLWTDGTEGGVRVTPGTVWFDHPVRDITNGDNYVWPEGGTVSADGTGDYIEAPNTQGPAGTGAGRIYQGSPASGDYVTTAGLSYESPGGGTENVFT